MKTCACLIALLALMVSAPAARAALEVNLAPGAANPASPQMGDQLSFRSVIRNTGTEAVRGLIAWISLIRVDPGQEQPVDLEDWSAQKAIAQGNLRPGEQITTDWPMRLIQAGDYRIMISVVGRNTSGLTTSPMAGLFLASGERYDLMIVDRMLPGPDRLTIIGTVRAAGNRTAALILSALGEVDERIRGLRAGGDDYMIKPFAFGELLARIDALLRRGPVNLPDTVLRVADLEMDFLARVVRRADRPIALQPQEFRSLEFLMRNAGRVVTRTMLFEKLWDYQFDPQSSVIDAHISRLRKKIDKEFDRPLLHTVRGAGYVLRKSD